LISPIVKNKLKKKKVERPDLGDVIDE